MDDVAVYGYVTASKLKIVLAFALSDVVYKDADVTAVSSRFFSGRARSCNMPRFSKPCTLRTIALSRIPSSS
jgi:hypothetical protein